MGNAEKLKAETLKSGRAVPACISAFLLPAFLLFLLNGCVPKKPPQPAPAPAHIGPTEPMAEVVARINANSSRIPTLWARTSFDAAIVDEKGKQTTVFGDGFLVYRKPQDLRLTGEKPGVRVFDLGSNAERYWLVAPKPGPDVMWWGYYRNAGKPCVREIPIRPDLILQVLGIGEINTEYLKEPVPTMRYNRDADAYVFVWNSHATGPDRWVAQKEIWYDRASKQPTQVLLYDANGRPVLTARLSAPKPVEVPGESRDRWPTVATQYDLLFPDSGSRMRLQFESVALRRGRVPNDSSFLFPDNPDVADKRQIDKDCEQ